MPLSVYNTPVTRDPTGSPLPTREQYLQRFPPRPFIIHDISKREPQRDNGTVILAVNHGLLQRHEDGFELYANDLGAEDYSIVVLDVEGGEPDELKSLVIDEGGDALTGVVFAGELPPAWFEQYDYFEDENEPDNGRLVEYPIDLFFMDIDGEWDDTSGNGIMDYHGGDWDPDIW